MKHKGLLSFLVCVAMMFGAMVLLNDGPTLTWEQAVGVAIYGAVFLLAGR